MCYLMARSSNMTADTIREMCQRTTCDMQPSAGRVLHKTAAVGGEDG